MTRNFITFRRNTDHHDKVMVFHNLTRQEAWDLAMQTYPLAIDKIFSESELARMLPNAYKQHHLWVEFETEVTVYKTDIVTGEKTNKIEAIYPISSHIKQMHAVTLKPITDWFITAKPEPTEKDKATQLGAHFEEVSELVAVLSSNSQNTDLQNQAAKALIELKALATLLYTSPTLPEFTKDERVSILDALADQVVTATGTATFLGLKWDKALTEVNQSNFSKFENGKPIMNTNRKIIKGKNYREPQLRDFV